MTTTMFEVNPVIAQSFAASHEGNYAMMIVGDDMTIFHVSFALPLDNNGIKEVLEEFIIMMLKIQTPKILVHATIGSHHPGDIADIPAAKDLMKRIVSQGFYGLATLAQHIGKEIVFPGSLSDATDEMNELIEASWYGPMVIGYYPNNSPLSEREWMNQNHYRISRASCAKFNSSFPWATSRQSIMAHAEQSVQQPPVQEQPTPPSIPFQGVGHRLGQQPVHFTGEGSRLNDESCEASDSNASSSEGLAIDLNQMD